jgi:hypothetical protein
MSVTHPWKLHIENHTFHYVMKVCLFFLSTGNSRLSGGGLTVALSPPPSSLTRMSQDVQCPAKNLWVCFLCGMLVSLYSLTATC